MNTDVYCEWNSDIVITPSGSVQGATGWNNTRERIIRNMITNSAQKLPDGSTTIPDYIYDPSYGIGMGALVDQNPTQSFLSTLKQMITQAAFEDDNVDPGTPPTIIFQQPDPSTFQVFISVQLINGQPGRLQITAT